jgi:hypothetical protein
MHIPEVPERVSELEQMLAVNCNLMLIGVIESSGPSLGGGGGDPPLKTSCRQRGVGVGGVTPS